MNFDYTDVQQMLLESAERLMAATGTVEHWRAQRELRDGLDVAGWTQFAELGWLALAVPEDRGGLGGSMEDIALLMTALGKGLAVEPFVSTAVLCGHILGACNASELRTELLEGVAGGTLRLALAHNELVDRFDVTTPRATVAASSADGYVLTGAKTLAFDAPSAGKLIVSATLDGAVGTALFLVDSDAPGVIVEGYPLIDGSQAADVVFDKVVLAKDALLADGTEGTALLAEAIDRATVALLGQAVGSMEACLDICSAYLKERKQFGQVIGKFQALQHIMADMLVAAHQARSILYHAIAACGGDAAARTRAVSSAKVVAGEAMQLVSRSGIQLHGGYGLTDEYAIGHYHRRLIVLEKAYGDINYHVQRLADAG
jgi:alkylation response protein AidB-like acyl-CoA dehydrogenase